MDARATPPRHARRARGLRHWLKRLHLWLGLSIGLVYASIALSGSVLALQLPLLRWSHPPLATHALPSPAERAAVIERIVREWAPKGARSADLPSPELPAWQLYFRDGTRRYLDPADGTLLLTRRPGSDVLLTLREWHTHLLAGRQGETALAAIGWSSLFMLFSGVVLWWPGRGRFIAHLRPYANPPIRRWLSWHRSTGAVVVPLLLLVTFTGTLMAHHLATRHALQAVFGEVSLHTPAAIAPRNAPIDWRAVLDTAQSALPSATLRRISLPQSRDAMVNIRARVPGEWNATGRSMVWIDPYSARLLARFDATAGGSAARIDDALYPLHSGGVGGWPWRLLVILCGLLPAFFVTTGFLFWRARTRRH